MPYNAVYLKERSNEVRNGDPLEHKDVIDGNDIHVVDTLIFELLVGGYVARDVPTTDSGERARYANLRGVSPSLLLHSRVTPYDDVSALEFGDMEILLWVVLLDCCAGGEIAARLNLPVGHSCNVVRN